jgi:hypothetical protein
MGVISSCLEKIQGLTLKRRQYENPIDAAWPQQECALSPRKRSQCLR